MGARNLKESSLVLSCLEAEILSEDCVAREPTTCKPLWGYLGAKKWIN